MSGIRFEGVKTQDELMDKIQSIVNSGVIGLDLLSSSGTLVLRGRNGLVLRVRAQPGMPTGSELVLEIV